VGVSAPASRATEAAAPAFAADLRAQRGALESGLSACRGELTAIGDELGDPRVRQFLERGKLLRATLVFASGITCRAEPQGLRRSAVAVELLHAASLLHDDLIDGEPERRGLPALHATAGASTAIVVGDYLVVRAFAALSEPGAENVPAAVATLAHAGLRCCLGELAEIESGARTAGTADYVDLARAKTGSLFAIATRLGAIAGGVSPAAVAEFGSLGEWFGVAYQAADDLADGLPSSPTPLKSHELSDVRDRARNELAAALARLSRSFDVRVLATSVLGAVDAINCGKRQSRSERRQRAGHG
jgi:geranylgeranyl diphosphate synthase type I